MADELPIPVSYFGPSAGLRKTDGGRAGGRVRARLTSKAEVDHFR